MIKSKRILARFAPSPTGNLHLGNVWAFLCAWLMARKENGEIILRIEDIDPARSRDEYIESIKDDLLWLGLDWDLGEGKKSGVGAKFRQSERLALYQNALEQLDKMGVLYPCFCTRNELKSIAGAPQMGDAIQKAYSGKCRKMCIEERARLRAEGKKHSYRVEFPDSELNNFLSFDDAILGPLTLDAQECAGDFPVCRSDGVFAYQLAVVIDDTQMEINQVIRGEDILCSVPRQRYLYSLLKQDEPIYGHFPLMLDHEGERLAKRHSSISVKHLKASGLKREAILGYIAFWAGLLDKLENISAKELLDEFEAKRIKKKPSLLPKNIHELLNNLIKSN